ncbi:hypothetical protein K2173_010187 [Erythroxylum novogranatense]|uniref:PHD-type zinc finger plants domain-containing protein n=1 Tax=Erythroxylum novogranatense TaxID=1862640 RepID=A0AAV8S765_9ROSI|nr:hypothetical protein K2173_014553 [Erythroxylum novogranatense]KAJ8748027.1 hypothetical protein K2173_010187 [Erythroxylum novogranatense]
MKFNTSSQPNPECCMCGDCGFSCELFLCNICQFRSQHRYCSNLYPKAESYQVCNWCLSHDSKEKSQNSSSSNKKSCDDDNRNSKKTKRNSNIDQGRLKSQRGSQQLQVNNLIKKQKSPQRSPSTRRRIITQGRLEEKLRRTRSEYISNNNGITRQVFINKVRRYKLLNEVSS